MTIYVAARADAHLGTTHFAVSRAPDRAELRQFSTAWYAPGSRLRCGQRQIPQVGETYGVVGVGRPGRWGLESGVNEHALAVASERIATCEPAEAQAGLDGEDLTRLGLERGRNAREALEVVAALIERFGHATPGAARADGDDDYRFIFADPGEAWILECAGRRWVARRSTQRLAPAQTCETHESEGAPEIRDDWDIATKGLDAYAREHRDWEGSGRIDFGAVFGTRPPSAPHPGTAASGVSLSELGDCLRARGASTGSMSVALPHDRQRPWPIWVCAGPAHVGVQLPVYTDALLPVEARDPSSAFDALAGVARERSDLTVPRIREAWKGFEAELEKERRQTERAATELIASKRDAEARRKLSTWSADLWSRAAAQASELAGALLP